MPFNNNIKGRRYFCNDCLPTVCHSCINKRVFGNGDEQPVRCYIIEKSRPDYSCEYMYSNQGFEHTVPKYVINIFDIKWFLGYASRKEKYREIQNIIDEISNRTDSAIWRNLGCDEADYREVLQWVRDIEPQYYRKQHGERGLSIVSSFFDYFKQMIYQLRTRVSVPDLNNDNNTDDSEIRP